MTDPAARWGLTRARARGAGLAAAAVAAAAGVWAAIWAAVVATRWVRLAAAGAAFGARLVTLRAYRRCPSCYRVLRREARVCRSCGASAR